MRTRPEVDVVGAQHHAGELAVGEASRRTPGPDEHPGTLGGARAGSGRFEASGQPTARIEPSAWRSNGNSSRSPSVAEWNAQRPLSQDHSPLTSGSSIAIRRSTTPRRWSVRIAQPDAQCSQVLGVDTRSNGRERNRYAAPVNAPTGQIWTVLPEK
jgi:hypothetical protein